MIYTDHVNIPWFNLSDDNYIKYPIPGRGGDSHGQTPGLTCWKLKPGCVYLEGNAGYRAAIRAHWFTFISLYGRAQAIPQDPAIEWTANHTRDMCSLPRQAEPPPGSTPPTVAISPRGWCHDVRPLGRYDLPALGRFRPRRADARPRRATIQETPPPARLRTPVGTRLRAAHRHRGDSLRRGRPDLGGLRKHGSPTASTRHAAPWRHAC